MAEKIFDDVDEVRRLFTEANDLEAKGENVMAAERWAELASVVDYIPDQQIFYSRAACLSYIGKDYPG
ncbi:hypothetical protein COV93_05205, partial [Candidatus Woesearchaeota archaeon CG11_big_fil_rev_8_21_14_0_20_43_8]